MDRPTYEPECRYCHTPADSVCPCLKCETIRGIAYCNQHCCDAFRETMELELKIAKRRFA